MWLALDHRSSTLEQGNVLPPHPQHPPLSKNYCVLTEWRQVPTPKELVVSLGMMLVVWPMVFTLADQNLPGNYMKALCLQGMSTRLWRILWLAYHYTVANRKSSHWNKAPLIQHCVFSPEAFDLADQSKSEKVTTVCSGRIPEDTAVPPTCGQATPVYACLVEKNADCTHFTLKAVSMPEAKTHRLGKYFVLGYNSKNPNAISAGSVWCCCSPALGNT